ncbi:hypothetical protein GCM10011352_42580 [Marinobacterium zhoushanense]|uniref:Uncharacterized protein n=1 Tax=Marinobacterium zhoushanense TaxID=1679163 RepID=A0ABQ1KV81_9GAMM|nr:hypothetical protein GCM10011352_42580 [Marinobacterium zhoushanense]
MKNGFLTIDYQRMTGVMTALKAHNRCNLLSQQIDDLAFAFITPLGAQNNDVSTHCCL